MSTPPPNKTGIERAIEFAGTQSKLAKLIGKKQQMVSYWKQKGVVTDPAACAEIERKTGVRCEDLNPEANWAILRDVLCAPDRPTSDKSKPPSGSHRKTKERRVDARAA